MGQVKQDDIGLGLAVGGTPGLTMPAREGLSQVLSTECWPSAIS